MRLFLAGLAVCLAFCNLDKGPVFVYWCAVCAYWTINHLDYVGKPHD